MPEAFLAWLPLIVIAIVFAALMRWSMVSYGRHVTKVESINDELVTINRAMIAELRDIKQLLKDRK